MNIARYFLVPCILCCMVTSAAAQKTAKKASTEEADKVFTKVEMLGGPNNMQEWESYVSQRTMLPASVRKAIPPGTYKVQVIFILDIHGKLSDIKSENDPGHGLAERAVNIFKDYKGLWQPANQCGRSVKSYKKMPVIFVVPAE